MKSIFSMNNLGLRVRTKLPSSRFLSRNFSVSLANNKTHTCKLLVLGGGTGGCTIASKFARRYDSRVKNSVIIVEPSDDHYYQALWTLVGAGIKYKEDSRRDMKAVLPQEALWIKDYAVKIDPENNKVFTANDEIQYEYLVIALGLKYDYDRVPGLLPALKDAKSDVSTIYDHRFVEKVYTDMQRFKGGDAIFTYPDSPLKCPGAPQKIAYLFDSYLEKTERRHTATIYYNTCLPVIFGVKKYADQLLKVVKRKNINVNYRTVLKEVHPVDKEAVFTFGEDVGSPVKMKYSFLHAVPPMSPPEVLSSNSVLVDEHGFLAVDKFTLQHVRFSNIYGIGDCTNTPNSKTTAAIARQSYVVERNLLQTMSASPAAAHRYDGYGACPLVTSYNTCILAEFLYNGEVHETFPFDQSAESRIAFYMKRDLFPFIYWHFMLKGRYHGPEFVRRLFHPFEKRIKVHNTSPTRKVEPVSRHEETRVK